MTEKSFLWTTGGAGDGANTYTRSDLATVWRVTAGCGGNFEGVALGYKNNLRVNATATNQVTIDTGGAIVDGKPYSNDSTVDVTIPSAAGGGNTRIDTIALEANWTAQTVRLVRVPGTDAASPVPPILTQSSGSMYQISLHDVLVNTSGGVTVTDARTFARFGFLDTGNNGDYLERDTSAEQGVAWVTPDWPSAAERMRLVGIVHTTTDMQVGTGDGTDGIPIPLALNGYSITDVIALVHTKGVTGTMDIQIRRRRAGSNQDVLSTKVTVGDEYYARDGSINTSYDDLATGDLLFVDVDTVHTTPAYGLSVIITCELP